jgi:uncharacterized membrane protein HdeD (DUF308 family)
MNERREHTLTGQIWWVFMLRGVLAAALGISALIWPTLTLEILVLFVGAYLIADGVMGLVVTFRRPGASGGLLQPVVSMVVGLVLVFWPSQSARTLFMVLGAAALFMGISYLVSARRYGVAGMDRRLMTTVGIVAAVLGVILLVWPGVAVVTVSWIIATAALVMAAVLIFLGVRFRQLQARVEGIPPTGPAS